jgi:tRNA threonylcarbamoyladenosine biosynthesis protein TsaB
MILLVMDTSGDYGVLALANTAQDGALLAARAFAGRRTLSKRLLGELDGLLSGEGLILSDVEAFGVGLGPGSFTGVRVGVTTAKTLAQVTGKPLVGIPTLAAYADPWGWGPEAPTRIVILPSRRGEVYAAIYTPHAGQSSEPFAEPIEALEQRLAQLEAQGPVIFCGAVGLLSRRPRLSLTQAYVPTEGLARLATQRLHDGLLEEPLTLTPLYVVPPSISTPRERPSL